MAAKEVKFSVDARDRMLRGVDILANAALIKPAEFKFASGLYELH